MDTALAAIQTTSFGALGPLAKPPAGRSSFDAISRPAVDGRPLSGGDKLRMSLPVSTPSGVASKHGCVQLLSSDV